jgi:hypothetical protein
MGGSGRLLFRAYPHFILEEDRRLIVSGCLIRGDSGRLLFRAYPHLILVGYPRLILPFFAGFGF